MRIDDVTTRTTVTAALRDGGAKPQAAFDAALAGQGRSEGELREAAQQLVATALVMPLLEEVRQQPLDANLFGDGGFGSDAFKAQLDTQIADRIVKKGNFALVESVYQHVMRQAALKRADGGMDSHA